MNDPGDVRSSPAGTPLLMTPGPTRVPERVLRAGCRVLHHRTPEFSDALEELLVLVRPWFGTRQADVLPLHATGRAGMEGAITNFFSPGDPVVVCCNGKFGEMWASFAELYGLAVRRVCEDWDASVDPAAVAAALDDTNAVAVLMAHSDTSTGVLNPVAAVAAEAHERDALIMVDGISSVAGTPFEFDGWGLDFAVTSSQKCLMSSPGLALAVVGERAWSRAEASSLPSAYLNFGAIRSTLARPRAETPGTTPVSLVFQVLEALRLLDEEGRDAVFDRHQAMARATRAVAEELGFSLQGPAIVDRSPTLTAMTLPETISPADVRAHMRAAGIQIAGGLGSFGSRCVRIGHMGDIRMPDLEETLVAFRRAVG